MSHGCMNYKHMIDFKFDVYVSFNLLLSYDPWVPSGSQQTICMYSKEVCKHVQCHFS